MKVISQILDKFGRDDGFASQSKCVLKEKKRNRESDPRSEKRRLSRAISIRREQTT